MSDTTLTNVEKGIQLISDDGYDNGIREAIFFAKELRIENEPYTSGKEGWNESLSRLIAKLEGELQ